MLYALLSYFILTNVLAFPFNRYGNGEGMWLPQSPAVKRMAGAGLTVWSAVVPGLGWGSCLGKLTVPPCDEPHTSFADAP